MNAFGDGARVAAPALLAEIGDDGRGAEAGARPSGSTAPDRRGRVRSRRGGPSPGSRSLLRSLARALTAAAVIALPPRRPRTTIEARSGWADQGLLRFRRRRRSRPGCRSTSAGLGAPAPISSNRRKSAVGALPIATMAPAQPIAPQLHARRRCGSCPSSSASSGTRGSRSVQITSLSARQARSRDAVGHHGGHRTGSGAPAASAAMPASRRAKRHHDVVGDLDHAAGMDDAHGDPLLLAREKRASRASARMIANERR